MGKILLVILIVVVVAAGATYGGYRMGDSAGFERANQVRQQFSQQRQSGQGGASGLTGNSSGAQGRGVNISGVIKSVDGDTITITLGQRDVQVKLSNQTQVQKAGAGSRDDLKAGESVLVTPDGSGGSNSSQLTAATITVLSPE